MNDDLNGIDDKIKSMAKPPYKNKYFVLLMIEKSKYETFEQCIKVTRNAIDDIEKLKHKHHTGRLSLIEESILSALNSLCASFELIITSKMNDR